MTAPSKLDQLSRRIRLAVGQRLLLGLAPALLAVVFVVALAYYGEIGRQAPEYVISGAAVLALLSLLLTWQNTRYLVGRLRRLGRSEHDDATFTQTPLDDLDRIEREVVRLNDALRDATRAADQQRAGLERRLHDQATMLAATIRGATAQVDEVRLPLHILLDARFGVLNENQEELLASARDGADHLNEAMRRLAIVADADRDALMMRPEPVAINDVLRAVLPMARARAERRNVRITADLEPALPRSWADRAALAEAIALMTTRVVETVEPSGDVRVTTSQTPSHCLVRVQPVVDRETSVDIVAARLLQGQGITVELQHGGLEISVPRVLA